MSARRILAAVLCCVLLGSCSYETMEVEIGHLGKARRDPFLAAQRYLEDIGYHVENKPFFTEPQWERTTVIAPASAFSDAIMRDHVLKWVHSGGHLLVFLEGGDAFQNDWGLFGEPTDPERRKKHVEKPEHEAPDKLVSGRFSPERDVDAVEEKLFAALGVGDLKAAPGKVSGEVLERQVTVDVPARFAMKEPLRPGSVILGKPESAGLASFSLGLGRVTVVAHAKPFRNRYIGEGDNAFLLWLLVGQHESPAVWFISGARPSFFGMLWESGWAAVVAICALIGLWLWRGFMRFGPVVSGQDAVQRQFGTHLSLSGSYLWRQGESRALLEPLRRAVSVAAERCGFHRNHEDYFARIAARSGLPIDDVRTALTTEQTSSPHQFVSLVTNLEIIRQAL